MGHFNKTSKQINPALLFIPLYAIGLMVLLLAICALLFLAYLNYWLPFNGYGDEGMSYLDNKPPQSLSGGDLTHFHTADEAFGQPAPNLSWGLSMAFERGDLVFARPFTTNTQIWLERRCRWFRTTV